MKSLCAWLGSNWVSFEACCQWALLSVQLDTTLLFQVTVQKYIYLSVCNSVSACWVFSCFCSPLNSDMDYWIFNMCTWSFFCIGWASQHNIFDSGKTNTFFLCSWWGLRDILDNTCMYCKCFIHPVNCKSTAKGYISGHNKMNCYHK